MRRRIGSLFVLVGLSIVLLLVFSSNAGEATTSLVVTGTPTPTRSATPPKATPLPSVQRTLPKPTPTTSVQKAPAKATPPPVVKETPTAKKPSITNPKTFRAPRSPASSGSWIEIMSEDFEICSMPCAGWSMVDLSNDGYERYWKDATYWDGTSYRSTSGYWAAWPARGGANGYPPSFYNLYSDNMDTRMIYGPFDLSDAVDAEVNFNLWREIEPAFDYVSVEVSTDGSTFQPLAFWDGFVQQWEYESVSLRDFTGYSMPTGYSQVWVAWRFYSDYVTTYQGPWVDDISIWKNVPGQVTGLGSTYYYNRNNVRVPTRYATVHLFDHNTNGSDYELATAYTDQNGYFQFPTIRNWEYWDSGDPDHTLDLYIKIEAFYYDSGSTFHRVTYFSGDTYKWAGQINANVPDGNLDLSYDVALGDPSKPAMWIFRDLRRAWEYAVGQTAIDPGSATVTWQANSNCYPFQPGICNSFFYASIGGPFIFIGDNARSSSDTVVHEIGHDYMFNANNWWYWNSSCWGHDIFVPKEASCGWSEGYADFFALAVNGDRCYDKGIGPCTGVQNLDYFDLENQHWGDGQAPGDTVEGRVAGALYDLFDTTNDGPYDTVTYGFVPIWNIVRTTPTETTFRDFSNSWIAGGHDLRTSLLVFYQNTIDYLRTNYLPLIMK